LTNTTTGNSGDTGISYHSFTSADASTLTGAVNFDDTSTVSRGMTFASVADVPGTGAITSATGFSSVTGTTAGDIAGTTTFNLTNTNLGTAASGDTYSGFGSSSSTNTLTGAVNFDDGNQVSRGMTFASVADVTGSGNISNITTFNLTNTTTGNSGDTGISYH